MTITAIKEGKKFKSIHESIFWNADDPRKKAVREYTPNGWEYYMDSHITRKKARDIDMGRDSYIWCFTGVRGAGKSTLMTFFGMKAQYHYGLRLVSNYPIEYYLNYMDGRSKLIQAEPLDMYKLLCFDADYNDCLILIDEAPDIVSHMAAMTWKNRLLNIFIRQLRKNHNSLFLGAQQFELIDKSMRWQTDILAECQDASRKYGWSAEHRGKCILLRLVDNSGMWTGESYDTVLRRAQYEGEYVDPTIKIKVYPRVLWGDDTHNAVWDTLYIQDVWESLKKVDIKLMSYGVGKTELDSSDYISKAYRVIDGILSSGSYIMAQPDFYKLVGELTPSEKRALSQRMVACSGLTEREWRDGCKIGNSRTYNFANFNIRKFAGAENGK